MRPNQPATAAINMRCRVSALTCALRLPGILTEHDSEHGKIRLAKPAPNYMGTPTWGHPERNLAHEQLVHRLPFWKVEREATESGVLITPPPG